MSIKGVVFRGDDVLLAHNDRSQWELPGGRLAVGESLEQCVRREIDEETGLHVAVGPVVHCWLFEVIPGKHVVVIAYGCQLTGPAREPMMSKEHSAVRFMSPAELDHICLPEGYRTAIRAWQARRRDGVHTPGTTG